MLYKLLVSLTDYWFGFNVFKYITVRIAFATFTALFLSIWLGPMLIRRLKNFCHPVLPEFESTRENKTSTPTMGGILILGTMLVSTLLWADPANVYVLLLVLVTVWLGALGFWDDYLKIRLKNPKGLRPRAKIIGQAGIGLIVGLVLYLNSGLHFNTSVFLPFFKKVVFAFDSYYLLVAIFIIMATSNAVNLTDGMDGLAIGSVLMVAIAYGGIAYVASNVKFAGYLNIEYIRGGGEAAVFCGALIGSSLGFLWFNCYPAEIFMGDIGSLPLGGVIGLLAIIVKQEISLIFVGAIFVLEAVSVVIQVASFKTTRKRVFLMTPLHHHFELKGWPETKVVMRFWIVGLILALFTLMTLKIR